MKKIILLFLTILIISCKANKTQKINISEIISFMIDKKAYPLPAPPSLKDTTTVISKKVVDSLLQVKLKVALYPTLHDILEKEIIKILENYLNLFEKQSNNSEIKFNELVSEKGHQIILADTIEIKKSKDFKNFDLLFRFSNFYFSKDKQKVLFTLGVSRSRLAGSGVIYVLKKDKEDWEVEYFKEIEEW